MKSTHLSILLGAAAIGAVSASAQTAPFFDNFDAAADGSTSLFTETNVPPAPTAVASADSLIVNLGNGEKVLRAVISGTTGATGTTGVPANTSDAIQLSNLTGSTFTLSTDFVLNSFSAPAMGSTINLGLVAQGAAPAFSATTSYRLLYTPYVNNAGMVGRLTLNETNAAGTSTTLFTSTTSIAPVAGQTYTMTLSGTYTSPTSVTLSGTLTQGGTTITVNFTDTTATTGSYFGYRTALNAALATGQAGPLTVSQEVDYNNFVAIPEPGAAALLLAGGGLLVGRRPRRAASRS